MSFPFNEQFPEGFEEYQGPLRAKFPSWAQHPVEVSINRGTAHIQLRWSSSIESCADPGLPHKYSTPVQIGDEEFVVIMLYQDGDAPEHAVVSPDYIVPQ